MRALAVALGVAVLTVCLAVPSLLHAQDAEAPPPAPASEPGVSEPPPGEPPAGEPPPAPDPEEPPVDQPPVEQAAEAEVSAAAPTAAAAEGGASVSMVDFAFTPATVSIGVGDTVTWVNNGAEDHDAQGSGFATGTISPGASGSATFSSPGSFSYICNFHPSMQGTVNVADPQGVPGEDGPTNDGDSVPSDTAPDGSEAAAGAAPGAAGSADGLPASGAEEIPLLILGVGLLGCGAVAAALARWRAGESALIPRA